MLETFSMTFAQMCRILLFLALGYFFNKSKLIPRTAEQVLSKFVTMLFLPCLYLYSGIMEFRLENVSTYSKLVLYGALFTVLSLALAFPLAKLFSRDDEYKRNVYRYSLAIPNTGAVATPLIMAFFGTSGLLQHGLFMLVTSVLTTSWGVMQLIPGEDRHDWKYYLRTLFNVTFLAKILGFVLGAVGAANWMPEIVLGAIGDMSDCYVIIALLLTGFSIADYPIAEVFREKKIYWFTLFRLLGHPLLFFLVMFLLKPPYMICLMVALTYASPCGMNTVIYPAAYGKDCKTGASMVLMSSLFAIVTVPLVYALATTWFA